MKRMTGTQKKMANFLNNYELITVYRAFDGTKFYSDQDGDAKCKEYNLNLIKELEDEMIGNVTIYNSSYFFEGLYTAYIKFHTAKGKTLFITWCKYNAIDLRNKDYINNLLDLDKWYDVHVDDEQYYELGRVSLDEQINNLLNLNKVLNELDDINTSVVQGE